MTNKKLSTYPQHKMCIIVNNSQFIAQKKEIVNILHFTNTIHTAIVDKKTKKNSSYKNQLATFYPLMHIYTDYNNTNN